MKYSEASIKIHLNHIVSALEFALGIVVVLGSMWYLIVGLIDIVQAGLSPFESFDDFIHLLLAVIIGFEVARILITHNLLAIIEILGFVMARKVLAPETTAVEILVVMLAFAILVVARWLLHQGKTYDDMNANCD
jgi:hypothetical protein